MKTIYAFLFFLFTAGVACAQEPVPEPDTLKNQVNQKDPTPDNLPPDANYTTDKIKIEAAELPAPVRRTLESGADYRGWQKGSAYKSKDGSMFILQMTEADTTRTYRFNKQGKLILE